MQILVPIMSKFRMKLALSELKSKILNKIRTLKKSVYNIHEPTGTQRLFQLRVGLSPLNEHKNDITLRVLHPTYTSIEFILTPYIVLRFQVDCVRVT